MSPARDRHSPVVGAVVVALPGTARPAYPGLNGRIAFASERDGDFEIYLMNADGSGQTRLTTNPQTTGSRPGRRMRDLSTGQTASACGKLDVFVNEVQAQAGNKIPAAAAADLIAAAQRIRAGLGCP